MSPESGQSHLFSLRIWKTASGGDPEYRGKIHHVLSGEVRHFRTWDAMAEFIVAQVEQESAGIDAAADTGSAAEVDPGAQPDP